ncbi:putative RNA-binding protein EIF1AD [Microcaecilia unicolor]|uniref:Probable RNA-binding protein EIF1AD n=1 Tax=Microcaecilia unicolor TaxID=1415580 RepID=A0A6P7ZBP4_9AMPH|nr:probable RNA-binding protein EIF1AD [Microcaecilia unicolor]XP_030075079.1 probable RNA-binding protein EIF1AD [Microcaecilia unicolor]XP_030075080.1 probable RNA-binding protein EIF1AD [Microcaecilia unicolor]
MSQATKRKHVVKEVLEDSVTLSEQQQIVQVLGSPGNNLHEVETDEGQKFLVSMPTKFRKNIWIKRGDFLIVDPIKEGEKVKAEIACILYKDHICYLKKVGLWPEKFAADPTVNHTSDKNSCDEATSLPDPENSEDEVSQIDSEDDSDLFVNTNRASYTYIASEEDSSEEEEHGPQHGPK